ncbi:MAG TPA: tetratricopeptide repeat protein [Prosthecochloris aestuarii]|uniref:Tetratricopeptide repeat protein n=1 Tax=Prosthecochloris aestuarii TaxID=1102 RepID=A0A831SR19_PROAE|nr:tetratricopeptide repeat protein [Prosthecochloris aestuarii]
MTSNQFDFTRDVLDKSRDIPVLVDFWAEWCAPCRMLAPVLDRIAGQFAGRVLLVKVNTEVYPDIATRFGVRGIPDVRLFIDGTVADQFTGVLPEEQIASWLKRALPSRYAREVQLASELAAEGNTERAAERLEEVLLHEADNIEALAMMSRLRLMSDPAEAASLSERLEGEPRYADFADAVRTLSVMLQREIDTLPEDPVRDAYIRSIEYLRSGAFSDALEGFIGVIRENRYYDDDGARKACVAIFRFLGEEHEVTRKHRRVFDRALY